MTAGRGRHSPSGTESGSTAHAMAFPITQRQRSWLDALIILSTVAVGFVVIGFIADVFYSFGDIILIFFLAWLLAFILSPIVARLTNVVPILPRLGSAKIDRTPSGSPHITSGPSTVGTVKTSPNRRTQSA